MGKKGREEGSQAPVNKEEDHHPHHPHLHHLPHRPNHFHHCHQGENVIRRKAERGQKT